MQTAFGHLNGYSAIYYTYMWSLVIAKDLFTEFKKNGLMNPETAAKYRNAVLAASVTKAAADLVRDFLGRPYSFQAYADWLNAK
jgi:thimet oligopeptidase